jgi:predicted nucleotidyltransferase
VSAPVTLEVLRPALPCIISTGAADGDERASADGDHVIMKVNGTLNLPNDALEAFCRKWKIREFGLFGSVLRDDFRPDSDVDVLVTFEKGVPWDLWHVIEMQEELEAIVGRPVDLVDREAVERSDNPFRKRLILNGSQVVYTRG